MPKEWSEKRAWRPTEVISMTYIACVLSALVWVSASSSRQLNDAIATEPFPVLPVPFQNIHVDHSGSNEAAIYYRGNLGRGGFDTESIVQPATLQVSWSVGPLNVGLHSASKASPAVDESGIYVGADTSWFYAYDHAGNLKWKFYVGRSNRGIHSTAAIRGDLVFFGDYKGMFYALEKTTGKLRWAVRLADTVGSSPLIFENSIIVTVETVQPRNGYVLRLNSDTGQLIWRSDYLGEQSHSSISISEQERLLFVGANNKRFFAMSVDSGKTVWQILADGAIKSSPLTVGEHTYFTTWGGTVWSVYGKSGAKVWTTAIGGKSQSSPTYVPGFELLLLGSADKKIYALNRRTGAVNWTYDTQSTMSQMASALVVREEEGENNSWRIWIYCGGSAGKHTLCAFAPTSPKVIREIPLPSAVSGVPAIWDRSLFLAMQGTGGLMKLSPAGP